MIMIFMYQKDFYILKAAFWFESQILVMCTTGRECIELSLYALFIGERGYDLLHDDSFTARFKEEMAVNIPHFQYFKAIYDNNAM